MDGLLVLLVVFVSNYDGLDLVVGIVLDFKEPLVEVFEAVTFGEVKHQEGGDRTFVV